MENTPEAETSAARIARRVAELRKREAISQAELAERVSELGHKVTFRTISKIEKQFRAVSADELISLALALNASLGELVLPGELTTEPVSLTPSYSASFSRVWQWMRGERPLGPDADQDTGDAAAARALQFRSANRPDASRAPDDWEQQMRDAQALINKLFNENVLPPDPPDIDNDDLDSDD